MKKLPILSVGAILAVGLIVVLYYGITVYKNNENYKNSIKNAETNLNNERYHDAISDYNDALKYKQNSTIEAQILLAENLEKSKKQYDSAMNLMSESKYLEAKELLKIVDPKDTKRYSMVKSKLEECDNSFIKNQIKKAKESANNNNYSTAISLLDDALKIDSTNSEIIDLKRNYVTADETNNQKKLFEQGKLEAEKKARENEAKIKEYKKNQWVEVISTNVPSTNGGITITAKVKNKNWPEQLKSFKIAFLIFSNGKPQTVGIMGNLLYCKVDKTSVGFGEIQEYSWDTVRGKINWNAISVKGLVVDAQFDNGITWHNDYYDLWKDTESASN